MGCKSELLDYAEYLVNNYNLNQFYEVDYEVMLYESNLDDSWSKEDIKDFLIDVIPNSYFEDDEDNYMKALVDRMRKDTNDM